MTQEFKYPCDKEVETLIVSSSWSIAPFDTARPASEEQHTSGH
jgi:hypothetical protein